MDEQWVELQFDVDTTIGVHEHYNHSRHYKIPKNTPIITNPAFICYGTYYYLRYGKENNTNAPLITYGNGGVIDIDSHNFVTIYSDKLLEFDTQGRIICCKLITLNYQVDDIWTVKPRWENKLYSKYNSGMLSDVNGVFRKLITDSSWERIDIYVYFWEDAYVELMKYLYLYYLQRARASANSRCLLKKVIDLEWDIQKAIMTKYFLSLYK